MTIPTPFTGAHLDFLREVREGDAPRLEARLLNHVAQEIDAGHIRTKGTEALNRRAWLSSGSRNA